MIPPAAAAMMASSLIVSGARLAHRSKKVFSLAGLIMNMPMPAAKKRTPKTMMIHVCLHSRAETKNTTPKAIRRRPGTKTRGPLRRVRIALTTPGLMTIQIAHRMITIPMTRITLFMFDSFGPPQRAVSVMRQNSNILFIDAKHTKG